MEANCMRSRFGLRKSISWQPAEPCKVRMLLLPAMCFS